MKHYTTYCKLKQWAEPYKLVSAYLFFSGSSERFYRNCSGASLVQALLHNVPNPERFDMLNSLMVTDLHYLMCEGPSSNMKLLLPILKQKRCWILYRAFRNCEGVFDNSGLWNCSDISESYLLLHLARHDYKALLENKEVVLEFCKDYDSVTLSSLLLDNPIFSIPLKSLLHRLESKHLFYCLSKYEGLIFNFINYWPKIDELYKQNLQKSSKLIKEVVDTHSNFN
jgi:hypothetical protein